MRDMSYKTCIIIPCYNEALRLDFQQFRDIDKSIVFLFVNDGSQDNTLELLRSNQSSNRLVLDLSKNVGKAKAVRMGVLHIQTIPFYNGIEWIGFWDADLATPLYEINNFFKYINQFYQEDVDAVIGSRVPRLGSQIRRSYKRYVWGRTFATVTSFVFKTKTYDSQCGAKLFRKPIAEKCFKDPFISKWIFDIEILLRVKNCKVVEYPLMQWIDIKGSKLKIFPTLLRTMIDIIKLRIKYS